ncbi:MAG TPA: HIT family protein [Candidatus Binatia bacterium]|nr:HIT family protein [Candidatus Binatia bacterium]
MNRSPAPNATMTKFGFPATVVADYDAWTVQLRPKQVTLGSLVLVCKAPVRAFHEIGAAAFAELERATTDIERVLGELVRYERINYLMLMMVDPDVHFHVIPRYSQTRSFAGVEFVDAGWPGPPDLKTGIDVEDSLRTALLTALRTEWKKA